MKRKYIERIQMKIYRNDQGVRKMSLVEFPAMEEDFILLNKDNNLTLSKVDIEKRLITGPAMIPNKDIYRFDKETNHEYYIFWDEETIQQIAEKYLSEARVNDVTLQHEKDIQGVTLVESWWVENPDNDKANALGYKVPKKTWMTTYRIDDDLILEKVKNGEIRGFSIEGTFADFYSEMSIEKKKIVQSVLSSIDCEGKDIEELLKDILNSDLNDDDMYNKIVEIVKNWE